MDKNTLILLQCLLGTAVLTIPAIIKRIWRVSLPRGITVMYFSFIFGAVFLGSALGFYEKFPHWDTLLHAFSGIMFAAVGYWIAGLFAEKRGVEVIPGLAVLFAFCFAVALGTVWEIYEFTFDGILNLNMQRFAAIDGTPFIGHTALVDTMTDLIADVAGALAYSAVMLLRKPPT